MHNFYNNLNNSFFFLFNGTGKPITNGRVMNGGVTDSKINITSNPLAGLDTSEDIMQPKVSICK